MRRLTFSVRLTHGVGLLVVSGVPSLTFVGECNLLVVWLMTSGRNSTHMEDCR